MVRVVRSGVCRNATDTGGDRTLPVWREIQCCQRARPSTDAIITILYAPHHRAPLTILYYNMILNTNTLYYSIVACRTWVNNNNNVTSKYFLLWSPRSDAGSYAETTNRSGRRIPYITGK